MSSIDVSQVPELVDAAGYPVMFEKYEEVPLVYPMLGELIEPAALASPFYGTKATVMQGMERFREREDGQDVEASTFSSAYTWYMKCRQFTRSIEIPDRLLLSANARAIVQNMVTEAAASWGKVSRLQKEDIVADTFQKGTLTAGSTEFFDGSFPNNTDPNPAFIYDGLPWFDTAHTVNGATYANHTASLALSAANLQTVLQTMKSTNNVNDRGERIMIRPDLLMVPGGLEFSARTILESLLLPGSANNDANVVRGTLELVVNDALDDTASASAWWVGSRNSGLKIADSGVPVLTTARDDRKKLTIVSAEFHFGVAVSDWRFWYAANKAAS